MAGPQYKKLGVYAPYDCNETAWQSMYLYIYLDKANQNRSYKLDYMSSTVPGRKLSDALDKSVQSAIELSDEAFRAWANSCDIIFWFDPSIKRRKLCNDSRIKHHFYADCRNWSLEATRFSGLMDRVITPTETWQKRMLTMTHGTELQTVYPDVGLPIVPVKKLKEPGKVSVLLSLFNVRNLRYRLDVLRMVESLLSKYSHVRVSVMADRMWCRDEQEICDCLWEHYPDRVVFISWLGDWEYMRVLDQADVFLDMNVSPSRGFLVNSAIQRGVVAAGYDIEPNRSLLVGGEMGILLDTPTVETGWDFETAVPDVMAVKQQLEQSVINPAWLEHCKYKFNVSMLYSAQREKRRQTFVNVWNKLVKRRQVLSDVSDDED